MPKHTEITNRRVALEKNTPRADMYSKENVSKRSFWNSVLVTPSCWFWQGALNAGGYGSIATKNDYNEVIRLAHRFTYHYLVEDLVQGLVLDHKYSTLGCPRHCVNPDHLRQVTRKENSLNLKGSRKGSRSGYRGVTWRRGENFWQVAVTLDGVRLLGKRYYPLYERHIAAYEARQLRATHYPVNSLEG